MADWLIALVTLSILEIILGVDNIIFIAILAGKLPPEQQDRARKLGLLAALVSRLLLLLCITWLMQAEQPLFHLSNLGMPESWMHDDKGAVKKEVNEVSLKDLILLVGGLFLIGKATYEIHEKLEGPEHDKEVKSFASFNMVIAQIAVIDIIFSLDSVITAVGMAPKGEFFMRLSVMVIAVMIAIGVMFAFSGPISRFVYKHPTMKMLALSFLILIGVMLVADGMGFHIPRGYIYFAMSFSVIVELMNMRLRVVAKPVELHEPPPVKE
jgi:predicted tellurium resistance membrane protein TerC